MFTFLLKFFQKKHIEYFAPLALCDCRVIRPYLLERAGIMDGTAILFAIPYLTPAAADPTRNLSAYAVSQDYHLFFEALYEELLPMLRAAFPQFLFAGFADHSPIDEVDAAARAGLGVIGQHRLLITPNYSSYVFLGEIVTNAKLPCAPREISTCEGCGACMRQCPASACGGCLSALTQKKGALTQEEFHAIVSGGSVWGCDICQAVCPHTQSAIRAGTVYSPIPFFSETPLAHLTIETLDAMSDEEFAHRAYAWRGRKTIRRNLLLMQEKGETPCSG